MTEQLPTPFAQSYWVIPGRLLAGRYPGSLNAEEMDERLRGLARCGVGVVINLMEEDEVNYDGVRFAPYIERLRELAGGEVGFTRFAVRDGGIPTRERMRAILDEIDAALEQGKIVYVHCWGGKGRTGTVIGCYLARHGLAVGQAALDRITELRRAIATYPNSPETMPQFQMVAGWMPGE